MAARLRGKHKPTFAPHVDAGDHVIVVNADKVVLTSGKADAKMAYRHSGYPGGLTSTSYSELMIDRADQVVRNAITGMLPKNRLGRQMATKLKVYPGAEHPHEAQTPEPLPIPGAHRTASAQRRVSVGVARHPQNRTRGTTVATAPPICQTTGRRKRAVARVRIRTGEGAIRVNGHAFEEYFTSATHRMIVTEPLRLTEKTEAWDIDVTIDGGGVSGQAGAFRLGIARALCELDPELRGDVEEGGLPDPGLTGEGIEEVRPEEGTQGAPVLQAVGGWPKPSSAPTVSAGVANVELTPELVLALGRAIARHITAATFLVGRDTRRSGPMLQAALSAGLTSEGADVVDVGVLPTPALAHLSRGAQRPGRGDLRIPQSLRRQWHQGVRRRRGQAGP